MCFNPEADDMRELEVSDLGRDAGYNEVLALQERLHTRRAAREIPDTLLLLEHRPAVARPAQEQNHRF